MRLFFRTMGTALPGLCCAAAMAADLPLQVNFSGDPGPYTVAQWKHDWPGCKFEGGVHDGRVSLSQDGDTRMLRVQYAIGEIGPAKGGAGWRFPIGTHETAELTYRVRFSPDFDFVKGGKLPGLCGGPENVSGGHRANGTNGFSARLVWRGGGRGEAYIYHKNQKGDYGDSFAFPEDFRFPTDSLVSVRLRVTMNDPAKADGALRVWITTAGKPERLMVERQDMQWRSTPTFGVDGVYFDTFHGGSDSSWAPTRPCWAEFGDITVSK